jgi:ABC-type cobalamin transport system permease subunit
VIERDQVEGFSDDQGAVLFGFIGFQILSQVVLAFVFLAVVAVELINKRLLHRDKARKLDFGKDGWHLVLCAMLTALILIGVAIYFCRKETPKNTSRLCFFVFIGIALAIGGFVAFDWLVDFFGISTETIDALSK